MKINFDNMRRQMTDRFNTLVSKHGLYCGCDLGKDLNDLRSYIATLNCISDPDQEDFSDLSDLEIFEALE